MKTDQQSEEDMIAALRENTFERLMIRRLRSQCYLIITIGDAAHVLCDSNGVSKQYRHAWQIREWLQDSFGILPELVPVESIQQI